MHNSTGASAFEVRVDHDPVALDTTFIAYFKPWIESTNRTATCLGGVGPNPIQGLEDGESYTSCNTLNTPPPYGATGTGKLMQIRLKPGNQLGITPLSLQGSFLVNTPSNPNDQAPIPATIVNVNVNIVKCADFDTNGIVDLFNDILGQNGVARRFGWNSGHAQWDWKYDLDNSALIDLFNDILGSAYQFGDGC